MSVNPSEKAKNNMIINSLFVDREDADKSAGQKTIAIKRVIWEWDGELTPQIFEGGVLRTKTFYATGDTILICSSIKDVEGGVSSEFPAAFLHFYYHDHEELLIIKGTKQGRNYTVKIFL